MLWVATQVSKIHATIYLSSILFYVLRFVSSDLSIKVKQDAPAKPEKKIEKPVAPKKVDQIYNSQGHQEYTPVSTHKTFSLNLRSIRR